jgi:hypothetical protein
LGADGSGAEGFDPPLTTSLLGTRKANGRGADTTFRSRN